MLESSDMTTIWQRASVEELVRRRLGDRANWRDQVSLMILIRRGKQAGRVDYDRAPPLSS